MRVLHVMEATIGGTRRHLVDVARGELALGLEVHLAVAAERQPDFRDDLGALEREGARVTELPMVREVRPALDLRHERALERLLLEARPDVIHTHASKAGALGRAASLRTGVGTRVHTPHTFAFLFRALFGPAKRALYRRIEGFLGRRTDRMIAVSESEGETIRASGVIDPARVRVVPNGIDVSAFHGVEPADLAAMGVPAGAPVAAVVGLVYEAKGQDLAVEALARPGLSDLHLLVAGEGARRRDCEALARRLGVEGRAHFLGWRRDVPRILAAADLLLVPSRWEGMPYVAMEAMAVGRPVVSTRVDGARELVRDGETGFLAEVGSPDAIAAACRRLLALPPEERRSMGRRGRALVEAGYASRTMVERTVAVYREVAGR